MSSETVLGTRVLSGLCKSCQEQADRTSRQRAGEVAAIGRRLMRLRRALRMHNEALERMSRGPADAMNLRLYRRCITDICRSIVAENARLEGAGGSPPGMRAGADVRQAGGRGSSTGAVRTGRRIIDDQQVL